MSSPVRKRSTGWLRPRREDRGLQACDHCNCIQVSMHVLVLLQPFRVIAGSLQTGSDSDWDLEQRETVGFFTVRRIERFSGGTGNHHRRGRTIRSSPDAVSRLRLQRETHDK